MPTPLILSLAVLLVLGVVGTLGLLRWGTRWGSTRAERSMPLPGDAWLEGSHARRVVMTRAISIDAEPEAVWPWLAQMGRGAGFYSIDWLDNGRRTSARHVVSWIPRPRRGDATAIGYLRHIEAGRSLTWWVGGLRFAGAQTRLVVDLRLTAEGEGSRLVTRMSADAAGPTAWPSVVIFQFMDSIMASRQLSGIRDRVEQRGSGASDGADLETGDRDQYQLYEVLYASGGSAGVAGNELAARWRRAAISDGLLPGPK